MSTGFTPFAFVGSTSTLVSHFTLKLLTFDFSSPQLVPKPNSESRTNKLAPMNITREICIESSSFLRTTVDQANESRIILQTIEIRRIPQRLGRNPQRN